MPSPASANATYHPIQFPTCISLQLNHDPLRPDVGFEYNVSMIRPNVRCQQEPTTVHTMPFDRRKYGSSVEIVHQIRRINHPPTSDRYPSLIHFNERIPNKIIGSINRPIFAMHV